MHGVKPTDLKAASDIKLKFNPDYYRILTQDEIERADRELETYLRSPSGDVEHTRQTRATAQSLLPFPTSPDEVNREMLSEIDESDDQSSDEDREKFLALTA